MYAIIVICALAIECQAVKLPRPGSGNSIFAETIFRNLLAPDDIQAIEGHAGLYKDKEKHPYFGDKVLVTAANNAYYDLLRNWQCYADRLGLDYIVIALDSEIYRKLEPDRTVLVNGTFVSEENFWRSKEFNIMGCNKLKMVNEILLGTGLDVIFSDPDNVFGKDPFANGDDLGDKIRSGKFQYIYQQNHRLRPNKGDIAAEVVEGNTGFYYVSGKEKKHGIQNLFLGALTECVHHKLIDDQTNFWDTLWNVCKGNGTAKYGAHSFECCNLCGKGPTCNASSEHVLDYCEMDPFTHVTSITEPDESIRTYHANFVVGVQEKVKKLQHMGFWGCSDNSSFLEESSLSSNVSLPSTAKIQK